jgi:hypothetical protein
MNQPENGGKAAERFTHYYNEMGGYTVVFDFNSDKEIPVGYFKAEFNARLACVNLNSILESSLAAAKKENEELKAENNRLREVLQRNN